jgi:hypothetical protein
VGIKMVPGTFLTGVKEKVPGTIFLYGEKRCLAPFWYYCKKKLKLRDQTEKIDADIVKYIGIIVLA